MADSDLKQFIREIARRNELVWQGVMAELQQGRAVLIGLQGEIAEVRADLRAHTDAVMHLIDEIRGRPDA